jgi:DNA-binding transcriptional MerR regulator
MKPKMTIGDFSQATRLTAKALRFYHGEGILVPAAIDPQSGYRLYAPEQISVAQVIRKLRSLEIPVDTIREVLGAPSVAARNELIGTHLTLLEARLDKTREAVSSPRDLLEDPPEQPEVVHRSVPATPAFVIRSTIDLADLGEWYTAARAELVDLAETHGMPATGPRGGIWATELFLDERGEAALFQPITSLDGISPPRGRATPEILPPAELVVAVHRGPDELMAHTYGALGNYVAEHELGTTGPIRETYLKEAAVDSLEVETEIGWPIFRVGR